MMMMMMMIMNDDECDKYNNYDDEGEDTVDEDKVVPSRRCYHRW